MKPTKRKYGYGIINYRGEVFWDESCVCQDREPMVQQAWEMNQEGGDGCPFKAVALYYFWVKGFDCGIHGVYIPCA